MQRLAEQGYRYGGLFRSLRGIGTDPARPEVVYAEVALPAGTDVTGYGIHPALLDAALHPLAAVLTAPARPTRRRCGFRIAFSGVTLHATAATQLHVQLTRTGDGHVRAARHRPRRGAGDQHRHADLARGARPASAGRPPWPGYPTACSSWPGHRCPISPTPAPAARNRRRGRCAPIHPISCRPACSDRARSTPSWPP